MQACRVIMKLCSYAMFIHMLIQEGITIILVKDICAPCAG
jgi:hypothetical protein